MRDRLLVIFLILLKCIRAIPFPLVLPVQIEGGLKVSESVIHKRNDDHVYQSKRASSVICGQPTDQLKSSYDSFNEVDKLLTLHFKTTNSSLNVLVVVNPIFNIGWIGIGLGRTMLDASFGITAFNTDLSTMSVNDFVTNGNYGTPKLLENSNLWSINCTSSDLYGFRYIQLIYKSTITLPQDIIWALAVTDDSSKITKHDTSGAILLTSSSADYQPKVGGELKWLHGYGMLIFVFLLHPLSVFNARYKPTKSWFTIHLLSNIVGAIIAITTPILLAVFNYIRPNTVHGVLGITLLVFYALQFILGIAKSYIRSDRLLVKAKLVHSISGKCFWAIAIIQVGLGLQTMVPFERSNVPTLWVAYIVFIIIWILVFVSREVMFQMYEERKEADRLEVKRAHTVLDKIQVSFKSDMVKEKADLLATIGMSPIEKPVIEVASPVTMLRYTWQDIDHAVSNGQNLIVANHKEVYDITSWLSLHPGGQSILNTVTGTDVTAEFFALILPPPTPRSGIAPKASNRLTMTISQQKKIKARQSTIQGVTSPTTAAPILPVSLKSLTQFTDDDFVKIMKSRRTHQHTHTAFQKMQTFRIGDLISDGQNLVTSDPNEYKRYAITDKKLMTIASSLNKVYKFRFCLMNADDSERMVKDFMVGECVEIQCKIGKSYVSRYYTPIAGNLSCFEIIVKINKAGQFSSFLEVSKTGDRQFKIRGGFGRELFQENAYLEKKNSIHFDNMMWGDGAKQWMPDRIYFLCAGTGISPFIQCINSLLMPVGQTQWARFDYLNREDDELGIEFGDPIVAHKHYNDGWSYGTNLRTQQVGIYPLSTLLPNYGVHSKFILINCSLEGKSSLFGVDLIQPAIIAFEGDHIRVENIVKSDNAEEIRDFIGNVTFGRLDANFIQKIIHEEEKGEANSYHRKVFVCGPSGFNDACYDILINDCQVPQNEVIILGNSSFIE